jgi:hypothetical protein
LFQHFAFLFAFHLVCFFFSFDLFILVPYFVAILVSFPLYPNSQKYKKYFPFILVLERAEFYNASLLDNIYERDLLRVLKEHIIRKRNLKPSTRGMSYVSHF